MTNSVNTDTSSWKELISVGIATTAAVAFAVAAWVAPFYLQPQMLEGSYAFFGALGAFAVAAAVKFAFEQILRR